jgi:GH25 family lysozyme M1 (1,4-beta-N-acetylmuramidase)
MSDYTDKRKLQLLNQATAYVAHKITGKCPFTPLLPAGADVAGSEWPWDIDDFRPAVRWVAGRASYGPHFSDNSIVPLVSQAIMLGIPKVFYHFILPNDIPDQIDNYLAQLTKVGGPRGIVPVCDIEHDPKKPARLNDRQLAEWKYNNPIGTPWARMVRQWLDTVEAECGRQAILYGRLGTFYQLGDPAPAWLKGYDVWLAWYPYWWRINAFTAGPPQSVIPSWARRVVAWQYWPNGRTNGLEPNDLNWVNPEYLAELETA